jgi:hypothetical protein
MAAFIAFRNTTRSLQHAEGLERHRRSRKHAAVRAVLPLALAQITGYAEHSAHALNDLINKCSGETLVAGLALDIVEPLPSETLKTLSEFIEYSDTLDVGIIESTVAFIQIHDSRIRTLAEPNRDPSNVHVVGRADLEARIIDAASIYAGAAAAFEYARRRKDKLPTVLSWDAVGGGMRNMQFWDDQHPRLYEILTRREGQSRGPFEG